MAKAKATVTVAQLPVGTIACACGIGVSTTASGGKGKGVSIGGTNWRIAAFIAANGSANRGALNSLNSHYAIGAYRSYHAGIMAHYVFDETADAVKMSCGANEGMAWVLATPWGAAAMLAHSEHIVKASAPKAEPTTKGARNGAYNAKATTPSPVAPLLNNEAPKRTKRAKADAAVVTPVAFVAYSDDAKATYGSDTSYVLFRPQLPNDVKPLANDDTNALLAGASGYYRKGSDTLTEARKSHGALVAMLRQQVAANAPVETEATTSDVVSE